MVGHEKYRREAAKGIEKRACHECMFVDAPTCSPREPSCRCIEDIMAITINVGHVVERFPLVREIGGRSNEKGCVGFHACCTPQFPL